MTRDPRPWAAPDEWLDSGLVSLDAEDRVVPAEAAFIPQAGDDGKLYDFGRNLHDHVAATVSNIRAGAPPFIAGRAL